MVGHTGARDGQCGICHVVIFSLEVRNTSYHDISLATLMPRRPDQQDYRRLSEFRYLIRRFLEFSEAAAARAGLTPRQHQALLAIKGAQDSPATIGYLAERLRIRHHSAVELVDRLAEAGLIERWRDPQDRRRVCLRLTKAAEAKLAKLSASHLQELARLRPTLLELLDHRPI
jgi:DNA-binding MarR family transcriptional regulator